VTATTADRLLGALEAFVGRLHCGTQSAGIDALIAADLTFSQMRTLLMLSQQPEPVPIHEIATRLELSVAAAGRNVDQLVRFGVVDRVEDELDRRIKRVSLSPAGLDLIATFKAGQRRYALELLAGVDEQDAQRLIDALGPVLAKLGCPRPPAEQISPLPPRLTQHRQEIPG
jgi:DNA-binding MarR family transcriptional regulator